jgi:transcriptional antiterminator RfaH
VVHTKPRNEVRARDHLVHQGYRCLLPMRGTQAVRSGRVVMGAEPLFPRYLFISLSEVHSDWTRIRSTRGVSGLVRFGTRVPSLADQVVAQIFSAIPEPSVLYHAGDRVRITEGAFAGTEGLFLEPDGEARVIILFHMLGADQRASFPVRGLAHVE